MANDVNTLASIMQYEINELASSPINTIYFDIEAVVHTPNQDIKILYPVNLGRLKDFINRYSDLVNLTVAMPLGTAIYDIYPFKEKLEITLKLIPLTTTTIYEKYAAGEIRSQRFIAKLTEGSSSLVEGESDIVANKAFADEKHITEISFQLISKITDEIKDLTVGFIARDTNPMEVIKYALTKYSKAVEVDASDMVQGVCVTSGYTELAREHVIIPHLTRLVDLPNVVNKACGGLYPAGFSYYLDQGFWFVYPLYDTTRFGREDYTLTILNVPKNRLPGTEKTFRVTPTQLIIIVTGNTKHEDMFDYDKGHEGDATRFIDSNKIVEDFGVTIDNKLMVRRHVNTRQTTLNDEGVSSQYGTKGRAKITSAINEEYSKLAARNGSKLMTEWQNSNDVLLVPGMPVRYMFLAGNETRQLYGTLVAAETSMVATNNTPTKKKFMSVTALSCFLERDITNTKQQ